MKKDPLNKQKLFDTAVKNMFEQGGPCKGKNHTGCQYHNPVTGRKCIVGSILTSAELQSIPEKYNTIGIATVITSGYLKHLKPIEDFLVDLQRIHDSSFFYESKPDTPWIHKAMAGKLTDFAARYDLSDAVVKKTFGKKKK